MAALEKINPKNAQTVDLLVQLAEVAEHDEDIYRCVICRDTGWYSTESGACLCSCGQEDTLLLRRRQAGLSAALDNLRFTNFDLRFYATHRQLENGQTYRQLAEKALRSAKGFVAAEMRGENPRGLYYEGTLGSGKTFLAAAIANELAERDIDTHFVVVPEFLEKLRLSYGSQPDSNEYNEAEIMRRALTARILVLDDLGAHNSTPWTISKMYTLLNHRLNHNLPCVITTNLKLDTIAEELGARTASRLQEMCHRFLLVNDTDIRSQKSGGMGWS